MLIVLYLPSQGLVCVDWIASRVCFLLASFCCVLCGWFWILHCIFAFNHSLGFIDLALTFWVWKALCCIFLWQVFKSFLSQARSVCIWVCKCKIFCWKLFAVAMGDWSLVVTSCFLSHSRLAFIYYAMPVNVLRFVVVL